MSDGRLWIRQVRRKEAEKRNNNNNKRKTDVNTLAVYYHKRPRLFGNFNYRSKLWVCYYWMVFQSSCYFMHSCDLSSLSAERWSSGKSFKLEKFDTRREMYSCVTRIKVFLAVSNGGRRDLPCVAVALEAKLLLFWGTLEFGKRKEG